MQKIIQYIFKVFFTGLIVSIVIACVVIGIEWLYGRIVVFNNSFITEIAYYCMYGVVLTLINSAFFDYMNHQVVWKKYAKYRLFLGVIGSISVTMIGVFFIRMVIVFFPTDKTVLEIL